MIKGMGRRTRPAPGDEMRTIKHAFWLIFLLLAAACSQTSLQNGTPSKPVYIPPASSATSSAAGSQPTDKPAANQPPTQDILQPLTPNFAQGDWVIHTQAGFAYTLPVNLNASQPYVLQWQEFQSSIASPDEHMMISVIKEDLIPADTSEACLEQMLGQMIADLEDVIPEALELLTVGGRQAAARRLNGDMFSQDFTGRMVSISTRPGSCITLLAVTLGADRDERWQTEGEPALQVMLNSMVISEVSTGGEPCQVSTDPDYGLSPDDPVRVGNTNLYDGYAREQLYMLALRGPNGETLRYEREGPTNNDAGEILDVYVVTYGSLTQPIYLYLDMYTYETPLAPLGFTCPSSIPLEAP